MREIRSADFPKGGRWNDFAIMPQGQILAIGGVDSEGKGSVELRNLAKDQERDGPGSGNDEPDPASDADASGEDGPHDGGPHERSQKTGPQEDPTADETDDPAGEPNQKTTTSGANRFQLFVSRLKKQRIEQLAWGKPRHGLRAAYWLEPKRDVYSMGDLLKQRYVVYNAGQRTLVLTTTPWLSTELTRLHVVDQNDRDIETDRSSYSGAMPLDTCMLRPGEAIEIPLRNLSIGPDTFDHPRPDILKATAGQACRLRGKLQIQHIRSPEQGTSPIVDHLWLETGDVEFKVTKEKRGSPDPQPQGAVRSRR
ncbi:MAG: hypothetical protein IH991_09155 [Planctomycetes bacterium]|nr:hypothetical protein [Planctomycetota bacterium]